MIDWWWKFLIGQLKVGLEKEVTLGWILRRSQTRVDMRTEFYDNGYPGLGEI